MMGVARNADPQSCQLSSLSEKARGAPQCDRPHKVMRFGSESSPEWLGNTLWCTSRFDTAPQYWQRQLSRRSTSCRRLSYDGESNRKWRTFLRTCFITFAPKALDESQLQVAWEKTKEPRDREQQRLRISVVQIRSSQEVCADHLKAVASRSVAASIRAAVSIARSMTGIWLSQSLK